MLKVVLTMRKARYPRALNSAITPGEGASADSHQASSARSAQGETVQEYVIDRAPRSRSASRREPRVLVAFLAAICGLGILWVVGFSELDILHSAAHDIRHSNALPCH